MSKVELTPIKNDASFRRAVDHIVAKEKEIDDIEAELQLELDEVRKRFPNVSVLRKKLDAKKANAERYAKANSKSLFGDNSVLETKTTTVTLKQCPPKVVLKNKTLTDAEVIEALKAADLHHFVEVKESVKKTAVRSALQGADWISEKLSSVGLKLFRGLSFSIKPKKPV